jgi:hypothetical protein
MNATQHALTQGIEGEGRPAKTVLHDSLAEVIMSGVVVVLAIAGLWGVIPGVLLPISAIVMGVVFLIESKAISARVSRVITRLSKDSIQEEQPKVGVTAEFIAGLTGGVLGLLALFGVYPMVMVPSAAVVYGSALIFGSGLTGRLSDLEIESSDEPACLTKIVCEAVSAASGIEFLFGLVAGIFGIVALTGIEAIRTSLAALLVVGASSLLGGATVMSRMAGTNKK